MWLYQISMTIVRVFVPCAVPGLPLHAVVMPDLG